MYLWSKEKGHKNAPCLIVKKTIKLERQQPSR